MTLTRGHLSKAFDTLAELGAFEVFVVGSAVHDVEGARDLDLACRGLAEADILLASERLSEALDVHVDLFRLEEMTQRQIALLRPWRPLGSDGRMRVS